NVGFAKGNATPEIEAVPALRVGFVVVKANEGQRADIRGPALAVGVKHPQHGIKIGGLGGLEEVAVLVTLAGDVARKAVVTVGPPEAGAVVLVKGNDLLGEGPGRKGLHSQVSVEKVVHLGAVLEEEAVAHAAIADAIADHEIVGAVDRQPAVS